MSLSIDVFGILANIKDSETLIRFGIADKKLAQNQSFWKESLKNKFGISSFLATYEKDPNINWFYMYQKFAIQELALFGDNSDLQLGDDPGDDGDSFIVPFPTIQVLFCRQVKLFMLLSLDGKVYLYRKYNPDKDKFEYLSDIEHKIQKIVSTDSGTFFLTEDNDVYAADLAEGDLFDYKKVDINFKANDISEARNYCIIMGPQKNQFTIAYPESINTEVPYDPEERQINPDEIEEDVLEGGDVLEGDFLEGGILEGGILEEEEEAPERIFEIELDHHTNITPIKQVAGTKGGFLILDIFGRVYNYGNNEYSQLGHRSEYNAINCLNYKFKIDHIYSFDRMVYLKDMTGNLYKLGSGMYFPNYTTEFNFIPIRNVLHTKGSKIFIQSIFDDLHSFGVSYDYNIGSVSNEDEPYKKSISIAYPGLMTLKEDPTTLDQTYDAFSAEKNIMILSYGVIEEDFSFLINMKAKRPELFIEDEKTTPKYVIKEINNQVYWYCRIEDDMFRVIINYDSQTGTIVGL